VSQKTTVTFIFYKLCHTNGSLRFCENDNFIWHRYKYRRIIFL